MSLERWELIRKAAGVCICPCCFLYSEAGTFMPFGLTIFLLVRQTLDCMRRSSSNSDYPERRGALLRTSGSERFRVRGGIGSDL